MLQPLSCLTRGQHFHTQSLASTKPLNRVALMTPCFLRSPAQLSTFSFLTRRRSRIVSLALAAALMVLLMMVIPCRAAGILVRSGQKIAFLGDSITQFGFDQRSGYVRLVMLGLKVNGVAAVPIPAGVSGNMSNNMLARLQTDVLNKKPHWMLVSCGVNDVWHTPGGVPLPDFKHNMTAIVSRAQAQGVKVMILTATMIGENAANPFNRKLVAYNAFLRRLAARRHCLLADVGADMRSQVKKAIAQGRQAGCLFTVDGVHPNPRGNMLMADDILRTFGCNPAQLAQARRAWLKVHWTLSVVYQVRVTRQLTLGQFLRLQKLGHKNTSAAIWDQVQAWFNDWLNARPTTQRFDQHIQHLFNRYINRKLAPISHR